MLDFAATCGVYGDKCIAVSLKNVPLVRRPSTANRKVFGKYPRVIQHVISPLYTNHKANTSRNAPFAGAGRNSGKKDKSVTFRHFKCLQTAERNAFLSLSINGASCTRSITCTRLVCISGISTPKLRHKKRSNSPKRGHRPSEFTNTLNSHKATHNSIKSLCVPVQRKAGASTMEELRSNGIPIRD